MTLRSVEEIHAALYEVDCSYYYGESSVGCEVCRLEAIRTTLVETLKAASKTLCVFCKRGDEPVQKRNDGGLWHGNFVCDARDIRALLPKEDASAT